MAPTSNMQKGDLFRTTGSGLGRSDGVGNAVGHRVFALQRQGFCPLGRDEGHKPFFYLSERNSKGRKESNSYAQLSE